VAASAGLFGLEPDENLPPLFTAGAFDLYPLVTWPVVEAAYYSFFNWNGYGSPSKWVGLDNFMRVWNDPIFFSSLFNNLLIILVSACIQVPLALALIDFG
jgi:ABC-type sugar transport system permease subunit